jgi:hypothetical protein
MERFLHAARQPQPNLVVGTGANIVGHLSDHFNAVHLRFLRLNRRDQGFVMSPVPDQFIRLSKTR